MLEDADCEELPCWCFHRIPLSMKLLFHGRLCAGRHLHGLRCLGALCFSAVNHSVIEFWFREFPLTWASLCAATTRLHPVPSILQHIAGRMKQSQGKKWVVVVV